MIASNNTSTSHTPMMRQYHKIKMEHPDLLLFFRLGDFYEMFFEDAITGSRELEITLTSRNNDRSGNPIPMCGIPYHAAENYLTRLLKKGFKVAICEQVEDPRTAKGIVKREVTRILTPGTTIEKGLLDSKENNYLGCLTENDDFVAAAFLDVSTGEFLAVEYSGDDAWAKIEQELYQFQPREILLPENSAALLEPVIKKMLGPLAVYTPVPEWVLHPDYSRRLLLQQFRVSNLEGFGIEEKKCLVPIAGALLHYVKHTQKTGLSHINGLQLLDQSTYLRMDESTVNNLELIKGLDGNRVWTLFATMDETCTGMGARLLRHWILRPSMNIDDINSRLDAVEELAGSIIGSSALSRHLEKILDIERLLSRATLEKANPRDLLAMRDSFRVLPSLAETTRRFKSSLLRAEMDLLEDLTMVLEEAIDDDAPVSINEGRIIREGYQVELDELRHISHSGKSFIAELESKERQLTGISSLKIKYNRVFGYFIEVTKTKLDSVPDHYIRKQTLVNAERFITPELKEYEDKVLGAEEQIIEIERNIFLDIRGRIAAEAARIQLTAGTIATLDVIHSFSEISRNYKYCRPVLDETRHLKIVNGRHPVLELQGDESFIANSLDIDADGEKMVILTGPNMGGKSTYLRQNALIVIMAQMGCFVPAESSSIGITDQIFTRVGASDNLARGRSTFMVEMTETARILNTATRRSLILLDEVGRGTATFDGLSIAWSVAEYLINRNPRTLFATHYQELTRLEKIYEGVRNYCVTVKESGGDIVFFHKVLPGIASKSYGIEVARLAGVPAPVIQRAREILKRLERKQLNVSGQQRSSTISEETADSLQQDLFKI
jgi:DNA mismatch repair protein MutS